MDTTTQENGQTRTGPEFPLILGDGLCASAVYSAYKGAVLQCSIDSQRRGRFQHERVISKWRPHPVVANRGYGGLSKYYHGVTPLAVLQDEKYFDALVSLDLPTNLAGPNAGLWNFVPLKVPRPRIPRFPRYTNSFEESLFESRVVYLCMSVVGNLRWLIKYDFLGEVSVSDDIVYRLGTISAKLNSEYYAPILTRGGALFPVFQMNNIQVSLRPTYFLSDVDLNFIDLLENFRSLRIHSLFEKAIRAVFLRYGIQIFRPRGWDVIVQVNLPNAYLVSSTGVEEVESLRQRFRESIDVAADSFSELRIGNFSRNVSGIMSGVHLGYSRQILAGIPKNLRTCDTSLNSAPAQHPTIKSYCESYNLARLDENDKKMH